MKPIWFMGLTGALLSAGTLAHPQEARSVQGEPHSSDRSGWHLVWADEFDRDGRPDNTSWTYETGFVRNHESQWYQPENVICRNGLLVIEGRRERKPNPNYQSGSDDWRKNREFAEYTSACLTTQGKHAWLYGRFEMKARIDTRPGLWPAFWTLGVEGDWPRNGEIDIMEYYREMLLANVAWGTAKPWVGKWHTEPKRLQTFNDPDWSRKFHVWRMDWSETSLKLSVDGLLLNETDLTKTINEDGTGKNPFHQPHYLLLNLAIGGDNGGDPSTTEFPARFEIEYVRVYREAHQHVRDNSRKSARSKGGKLTSEQIDALWDYNNPAKSFQKFQQALASAPDSADEIRTQIARCLGLQSKFEEGRKEIAKISSSPSPVVAVRIALESGRLENSAGNKIAAEPYFLQAYDLARKHDLDFYAIDAAHMMGIVTSNTASLDWNEKAIRMAEASKDRRARNWKGSLLNNTGWTYHDMGQYEKALTLFQSALDFQKEQGNAITIRIATWTVGRCLRSLKRYDEALAIQRSLEGGPSAGYIEEELGELLLVTGHPNQSKPYFKKAYELLSTDIWLKTHEAPRLERLNRLGE